ncbi:MAG: NAD(P)H-binding protein [Candidatus Accumulibacter sp.]|uniref:NAD-dependent epimerase/dehydratase family protein n=1 Tax=Accumulibacter sp. TaxID=2053492 RepID=UPI001ACADD27|nr:NAD-dependent epimerase/dehydratase family protein [Accumulibacter sp.]MBN8438689.1 NAD(P)H-binding protein [Accumulibacter sp.]
MKVLVTGGTGFTGSRLIPLLLKNGIQVRALVRPTSDRSALSALTVEWAAGDLSDTQALISALRGVDALVNIASLGFGHAESILKSMKEAGVKRGIFISTTAIFTQLNASSKSIRLAAEEAIQASGLEYTILRPTMIYGSPRDRNMWRLIRLLRITPIMPIFGDGESLQQPIFVDDVAQAVLLALQNNVTIRKSYNIAGKDPLTYNQVIDTVASELGKRVLKMHLPYKPIVSALQFTEWMRLRLPIKAEQVLRLNEDKSFSYEEAKRDFGFTPRGFEEGIRIELND